MRFHTHLCLLELPYHSCMCLAYGDFIVIPAKAGIQISDQVEMAGFPDQVGE